MKDLDKQCRGLSLTLYITFMRLDEMLEMILSHHWEIFISLEIASVVLIIAFLLVRYLMSKSSLSHLFLLLFLLCLGLEVALGLFMYQRTGEISSFTIIIGIFIVYSCTFGISDFKKLDRYMKQKLGKWRGINLLTEEEIRKIEQANDPKEMARKARLSWYIHVVLFVMMHSIFWIFDGHHENGILYYVSDLSWWGDIDFETSPFHNEIVNGISKLWMVVFGIDTIISWSYTFFPTKRKRKIKGF